MTPPTVTAWTDYKSPYAYLAVEGTYALEDEGLARIDWRPYTLRIEEYLDPVETRTPHHWRRVRYSYMDARRLANKRGLTVRGPQRIFNAELSSAGMLWTQRHGGFRAYHDRVFERFWKRELDLDVPEQMAAVVDEVGGDGAAFLAWAEPEGRAEVRALAAEAEAAGVFGVPSFVLDGEIFWGGDRLDLLRERLAERAPG